MAMGGKRGSVLWGVAEVTFFNSWVPVLHFDEGCLVGFGMGTP